MDYINMVSAKSLRIFFISLVLVFIMAVLSHVPLRQSLSSPASVNDQNLQNKKIDILEKVKFKLSKNPAEFKLEKSIIPQAAAGSDYDNASAYGVIDYDSGEVLISKNLSQRLPIASLTKIMTAIIALDLAEPQEDFIVSRFAAAQIPTKVMLKPGEKFSFRHLLESMLIASANDSTQAIQEGIDTKYGQKLFIESMNYKAKFLGLKNTKFTNPQGFDNPNHYSSVEDLGLLAHYAMENYPLLSQIVVLDKLDLTNNSDFRFYLNNWNGLLGVYPGTYGLKTGNTENSGYSTIVLSQREGKKLIAIVLGAPGVLERDMWTGQLLDIGFNKIAGLEPVNITKDQLKAKYASWKYF